MDERESKLLETVFSIDGQQMAIKNSVSNDFLSSFVDSIYIFDCRLPSVQYIKQYID